MNMGMNKDGGVLAGGAGPPDSSGSSSGSSGKARIGARTDPSAWLTERHLRLPDGSFPHLGVSGDGDVARVALLSGSPERVELMATMLEDAEQVGQRRGYAVYTGTLGGAGTLGGEPISVATSGVGSPSMAIAVEELAACGASTFIRVGSCAAVSLKLPVGGLAIASGAVCDEGTSGYYAPANFPPVANYRVLTALVRAAERQGVSAEVGLTRSTDSFYAGERLPEIIERWSSLGVLTFEMETSALFTVAASLGCEAGSVLCVGSNLISGEATYQGRMLDEYRAGQQAMIEFALEAAADLASAAQTRSGSSGSSGT